MGQEMLVKPLGEFPAEIFECFFQQVEIVRVGIRDFQESLAPASLFFVHPIAIQERHKIFPNQNPWKRPGPWRNPASINTFACHYPSLVQSWQTVAGCKLTLR
jgi:hypothetical protein